MGLPRGVYAAPPARLPGRGGAINESYRPSARLTGRAQLDVLARLLGRLTSDAESVRPRLGRGPLTILLTPALLKRGTCLLLVVLLLVKPNDRDVISSGVVAVVETDETDPAPLLRVLAVKLSLLPTTLGRGEARGGVVAGAGSLERAD